MISFLNFKHCEATMRHQYIAGKYIWKSKTTFLDHILWWQQITSLPTVSLYIMSIFSMPCSFFSFFCCVMLVTIGIISKMTLLVSRSRQSSKRLRFEPSQVKSSLNGYEKVRKRSREYRLGRVLPQKASSPRIT